MAGSGGDPIRFSPGPDGIESLDRITPKTKYRPSCADVSRPGKFSSPGTMGPRVLATDDPPGGASTSPTRPSPSPCRPA